MLGEWRDDWLYIHKNQWSPLLASRFTMKNLEKEEAKRMQRWGWNKMKDELECFKETKSWFVKVPLGVLWFAYDRFDNKRTAPQVHKYPEMEHTPHDYQSIAIERLLWTTVGLLHASTGAGKTIMAAMIAKQTWLKTLIVVKDKTLLGQMVNDMKTEFGFDVPYFGGTQKKSYKPTTDLITVCCISSRHKIDTAEYDCIILDEVHTMLQSDERREWVQWLNPHRLYGMTGTIKLNKVDNSAFRIFLWDTTECKLNNFTPKYLQVYTDYVGYLDDPDKFAEFSTEIYTDHIRNELIVDTITKTIGDRKGLCFVSRVDHAKLLAQMLEDKGITTRILIWEVNQADREKIKTEVSTMKWPIVIVGNTKIIGTGFNLPELSVAYLTTAERFRSNIQQYVWRIVRKAEWKTDCYFYDFVDISTWVLYNQSRERARAFKEYYPEGVVKQYY